ncbi:unnamed protein product [Blepharisma stoltei]|uniref:UvrD-like helicase ATP-binding domain-containing protein n=1 Tax=Blepharisma stoltei TaxID=1481888 RepID=A0AAU9J4L6_9CILI|nr:unnamed protein product [Blepharisma stoltei]
MDFPKKSKKAQSSSILGQDSNQSSKLKATIASLVEEIHSKMVANLWQMYYEFSSFMPINYKEVIDDPYEIWTTYLPHEIEKYEKDHFSGEITLWKPGNIIDHSMMSAFWKSCDIFEGVSQVPWRFRVSEKAFDKIKDSCRELKVALLKKMIEFSLGFILEGYNCEIIRTGPCIGMVFFSFPFIEEDYDSFNSNIQWHGIAACIVERIPVIKDHKVIEYSYEQYIKLLSVVDNTNLVPNEVDNFCDDIREDPDRWLEYSDWIGCLGINNQWRNAMGRFYPIIIPQLFLTEEESNSIAFDAGIRRWIWTDPDILENWEKKEKFKNNLVKLLSEENSCKDFIRLLKTLPNMTLKLTDEELELISTPGNVLTIGRSGTGKTTCSLLRMFSAEILFRYKMQKNKKLKAEDIDNPLPLHFVFATASPVLTNEVKIYYKKLKKLIKNGLKSKEKQQNLEEEKEIELKKENPQLTQVEEIEKEINTGPHSMKLLKNEDFPLFATIRKLVLMIDGSLERPFFSRDKNGRVIGSSCNFEWHNEQKGALEISKDYKKKKREQSEFISDSDSDEEYNKYYETDWDESQRQIRSWEIDFAAFSERFYPSLTWKNKFSPLILWTEISAYIKGSPKAYLSRGFYLSQEEYLELGRKSSMLSKEEKVEVYRAFGLYEDWKRSVNGYDFQDLVNYILCEIHYHGYKGIPIHYMMIDEVQDLTSATLNLLMQVTDQKLVFSGDTAQTIAKGVGFRFCDLKSLFFEASMTPPTVRQLTINFRSHNQILELANSVVALLETLFPLTIDKMGKEKSLKDGPHPIIINSGNPEDLLEVLYCSSEENPQLSNIQFGCSQVVIVRNQSSKFKLPSSLNTALCLTVYEAKGLEFDDVILYNVFTDSEMPVRCWKALYHFIIKNKDYGIFYINY